MNIHQILGMSKQALLALFTIISLGFAGSDYAATTTVDCSTVSNAHDAIQTAINSAAPGDVIDLVGTCQLDGRNISINTSNITIEGVGAVGNWSSVLKGLINTATGHPLGDKGSLGGFAFFNRGFTFGPTNAVISGVVIQGIKFQDLNRGINVTPSINATASNCNTTIITNGTASNINIINNWFENNNRDVSMYGTSDHVTIANNLMNKTNSIDVFANGVVYGCSVGSPLPLGTPEYTNITGNTSMNDHSTANTLQIQATDKTTITNNVLINNNSVGNVGLINVTNALVSYNTMDGGNTAFGGANGVFAFDQIGFSSTGTLIVHNQINNAFGPIVLNNGANGISVVNNQFNNTLPGFPDITLCGGFIGGQCFDKTGPSFNNKVITTNFSTSVVDFGDNNQLLGTQNLLNNPNVPGSVISNLINNAIGKPQNKDGVLMDYDPDQ